MASMLIDYLVTDAFVRSGGRISFPGEYIEGYAYLQNYMYGSRPGTVYGVKDAQLWMPARLLATGSRELNYIAARAGNQLLLAFTNQSASPVTSTVTLNPALVKTMAGSRVTSLNGAKAGPLKKNVFSVNVAPNGIAVVAISQAAPQVHFQQKILAASDDNGNDYAEIRTGNAKALLFKLGGYGRRLFLYLEDDDNRWRSVRLHYTDAAGKELQVTDGAYPFEFTVPLQKVYPLQCWLSLTRADGTVVTSEKITIGN